MGYDVFFALLFTLFLIYIIARIMLKPIKLVLKILLNSFVGLIYLWVINLIGGFLSFHIGINLVTILIAGFLGLPGVLLLIAVQLFVL